MLGCVQGPPWSLSHRRRMVEDEEDRPWPWWSHVRGEEEEDRGGRGVWIWDPDEPPLFTLFSFSFFPFKYYTS